MDNLSQFATDLPPSPKEGLTQLIIFIMLFIIVAVFVYFIRMLIRYFKSRRKANKRVWRWDTKQVFINFIKFILYFAVLIGFWAIITFIISGGKIFPIVFYDTPSYILENFINGYSVLFTICAVLWSLVAPYIIYLWKKSKRFLVRKPKFILHIKLFILSIVIFFISGIFFANIVSSQSYWDFIIDTRIYNYDSPYPELCSGCVY
jgi:hypothetical protein